MGIKSKVYFGGTLLLALGTIVYTQFLVKGDAVNRMERETFISRGADKYEVTVLNTGGIPKVYQTVSKVTSEVDKGYYFFWTMVNGHKVYVQSPIGLTLIEEK